ncbi:fimbrial assembly protein [Burkholderia sp. SRS-W-2-2016]|uniref:fimbria/pilus outer membrane usher protein n=1 Tax=Burkholderia sp. SRS-W-2-2016 TaxID=1926878 RepID=UPI00094AE3AF|nr:fimbria/pilus outer membrane usher protein [Burkholderia sp. SRS-W-2-2016]OLL32686.1 fimbrial assembly protein [Burkholderia sp. SRS-W-2-2016]
MQSRPAVQRRRASRAHTRVPTLIAVAVAAAVASPAGWAALIPPLAPETAQAQNATLFLELVVNQRPSGKVVPVENRAGHYYVMPDDLRAAGVPVDDAQRAQIAVDTMAQVHVDYDANAQRLLLAVPPEWLPGQDIGRAQGFERVKAQSSFGGVLNYDAYTSYPQQGSAYTSVWNEARLFGNFGVFTTNGVYQYNYGGGPSQRSGYTRYDTSWRYTDDERMITYEAGDFIDRSLSWSSPVRIGGVQVSRDFSVRPDVVTYPLPQYAGQAAVPTTVDLFVNGFKASSSQVNPGPFTLTNVPFVNGAGQATVVTTDALGRQVSTTVPFYVTSSLLKPGLSDYAFAAGALRRNYGLDSFDYGKPAGSASYRYGVSNFLTLEGHAEGAPGLAVGGVGGVVKLAELGVLNVSYSRSEADGKSGSQASVGYQYNSRNFGFGAQRIERSAGYNDLSGYDQAGFQLSRSSTQAYGSVSLARAGSVGAGYFDVEAADGSRTRILNLSYTKALWHNSTLSVSANRAIGAGAGWSGAVQLSMPFGGRDLVSTSLEHSSGSANTARVDYSRSTPTEGGFGWNLGYSGTNAGSNRNYEQGSLTWRGNKLMAQAGAYGSPGAYTGWADLSGSLVMMDRAVFAANKINDAFVVVSTDGQPDIPVRYENQLVGSTDSRGHLLVPWSTSYYGGKYEIDPLGLGVDMEAPEVEKRIAVKSRAGYLARFPVQRVLAASVVLQDAAGKNLPVGASVETGDGQTAYVGWDGLVYLEHLQPHNVLTIELPDGGHCATSFDLSSKPGDVPRIGPLVCR